MDTDMVSKLSTLNNNETDKAGTKTGDNNNDTNQGETTMGNDTKLNKRELILGVLSSGDLANEISGVRVSLEVSVKICLGITLLQEAYLLQLLVSKQLLV